ncbi:MAG: GspH/FimT family pseudopilin [Sulfuricellaceae bacterium]|nr:GspH/FimT family pseudopilin [Sulfuricellaceae bacterium]
MLAGHSSRRIGGFTLVELMISVAIFGIVLALAMPGFNVWMQNTQIRTATESLQNGLQMARAEAVRRNEKVRFDLGTGTSWIVSTDAGTQLQSRSSSEGSKNVILSVTPTGAARVTFNSLGRVVANTDGSASFTQINVDVPTTVISASQSRDLRVLVTAGGNIRTCDPSITVAGDPRMC